MRIAQSQRDAALIETHRKVFGESPPEGGPRCAGWFGLLAIERAAYEKEESAAAWNRAMVFPELVLKVIGVPWPTEIPRRWADATADFRSEIDELRAKLLMLTEED